MVVERLFTIGVYGYTATEFLTDLKTARVDVVVDIRQRRAVRGPRYAFSNATRLDAALSREGIQSIVYKDLAPSKELRERQRMADKQMCISKHERDSLAFEFVQGYNEEVLAQCSVEDVLAELSGFKRPALLCVERHASACHRSQAAAWIASAAKCSVEDIEP